MKRRTVLTAILTPLLPLERVVLLPASVTDLKYDHYAYMMALARRIMPEIILKDIIAAQPMTSINWRS